MITLIYATPAIKGLTPAKLNIFMNHWDQSQFEIIINELDFRSLSDWFEYLCYGSTAIVSIFYCLSAGAVFRRQILTYNFVSFIYSFITQFLKISYVLIEDTLHY